MQKIKSQAPILVFLIFSLSILSVEDTRVFKEKKTQVNNVLSAQVIRDQSLKIDVVSISVTPLPTLTLTLTPSPTLTPTATPKPKVAVSSKDLDLLFEKYSQEYNVDKNLLTRIALCESGFSSESRNGPYAGMFQFTASSWSKTRIEMGLSVDPDLRTNAEESIRTAAYKISRYGAASWPNCNK